MQVYNDELYHYGKPGMKWGRRVATNISNGVKAQTRAGYDQFRHPVHSTKAQISMLRNHPIRTLKGGTKVLNELNADVAKRVSDSKKLKKKVDRTKQITKGLGITTKVIATMMAANQYNKNSNYSEELRNKGSNKSALVVDGVNRAVYNHKVNKIWE